MWLALFALSAQFVFQGYPLDVFWAAFDAMQFRRTYAELQSRD